MAVCQGQDLSELISTYQTLVDIGYKHIAFNHSSIAYENEYPEGMPRLKKQMYGRMEFIRRLVENRTIHETYYHHLLGCSLPQEFMAYDDWKFIKSCDTSNPILVGAEGVRYDDGGINWKPKEKLEEVAISTTPIQNASVAPSEDKKSPLALVVLSCFIAIFVFHTMRRN